MSTDIFSRRPETRYGKNLVSFYIQVPLAGNIQAR